jgi:ABC-type amino acid transport substrate-binding protein
VIRLFRVLLLGLISLAGAATAAQEVRVGAYHFPPYVLKPESEQPTGLLPELLQALNLAQDDYRFNLVATSTKRRYRDLQSGRFDLILFESPSWGWQDTAHEALDLHIEDAEVYVARLQPGRDEAFFADFSGKRMALYNGYHYGFAGFNSDQAFLTETFNALLTYSHDSNLIMLLRGRADVAVVTRSFLQAYLKRHPEKASALLVSQRLDQVYRHQALLRAQSPISAQGLAGLLQQLNHDRQLDALLERYHVVHVPAAPRE